MKNYHKASCKMMKVSDLCEYLSVSDETIYRWIKKKKLPAHRVGKLWMFRLVEIDNWIDQSLSSKRGEKNEK